MSLEIARSVRARLQSCRKFSKKAVGFSPCISLLSVDYNLAAAEAGIGVDPFAARLKSCPDAYQLSKDNFASGS
jgi:hypothetical protein